MKQLTLILLIALVSSCGAPKRILKGTYQDTPYQIETNKSFDDVWSNVIDMFATKGLSIKIIDKSSGIITSGTTSFLSSYCYETKEGKLFNPNAFVVVNMIKNWAGSSLQPQVVTGEWNIRVKKVEDKTIINVNLVNIIAQYKEPSSPFTVWNLEAKSTGVFEKTIADIVR